MISAEVSTPRWDGWKEIYMAALFEADKERVVQRIEEAERAVVLRTRELYQSTGNHLQERKALEAALCALRALRNIHANQLSIPAGKGQAA